MAGYEKTEDVYERLEPYMGQAIDNARQLEEFHKNNGQILPFGLDVNPFTDVFHLVETLI